MNLNEHVLRELGNLEIRLRRHVLHSRVRLVHELVKFVEHCLQEGPMIDQECGELTDHVHDVCCDLRLAILSVDTFTKVE